MFRHFATNFYAKNYKKIKNKVLKVTLKKCFGTEAILKFENVLIRNNSLPVYKTSLTILLDKIRFGCDIKAIVRHKGGINCTNYIQVGEETVKIIGYRERILNTSAITLFYFCGGEYFMGEYFFPERHETVTHQLAKTIFKRYSIAALGDETEFYIEDEQGSILYFCDNGFSLSVKYFNPAYCQSLEQLRSIFQQKFEGNQKPAIDTQGHTFESKL